MRGSGRHRLLRADALLGLALAVAATGTLVFVVPVAVNEPPGIQYAALSPAFLPRILLAVVALAGLWLAASSALARGEGPRSDQVEPTRVLARVVCVSMLAFYALALPELGATLTAVLATSVLLLLGGVTRWTKLLAYGVLIPVATVQFFVRVGKVPLPAFALLGQ
jgi:hypothetical protein